MKQFPFWPIIQDGAQVDWTMTIGYFDFRLK